MGIQMPKFKWSSNRKDYRLMALRQNGLRDLRRPTGFKAVQLVRFHSRRRTVPRTTLRRFSRGEMRGEPKWRS